MGIALMVIGGIAMVVGGIGILIAAFHESVIWGIGCMLIPIVSLIFVVMHWQETKKPFLINVVGTIIFIAGGAMSGPSGPME